MEVTLRSQPSIEIGFKTQESKFSGEGYYPQMQVGLADDLSGHGESVPASFGFRASGGKSIKDGRAYIKRIKGNSVVWNQILNNLAASLADKTETDTEVRIIPTDANGNRFGNSVNVIEGHYYLQMVDILSEEGTPVGFQNYLNLDCGAKTTSTSYVQLWQIAQASASGTSYIQLWSKEGTPYRIKKDSFNLIDLTKMFQAGNEPTTIEEYEARKPIVEDEYAYNEGQVIHCNTESIKSVGDNAWDEQWRLGFFVDGQYIESPTQICSKNPTPVLPNATYCINQEQYYVWYYDKEMQLIGFDVRFNSDTFVTPSNAAYIHFNLEPPYGTTYKNDIMLTLVHSGWKQDTDAGYQPYWQDTLPLPIIRKYFPDGMKLAGSAHDEIRFNKASGKWEQVVRIGSVDMGDLDWGYYPAADGYPFGFFYGSPQGRKYGDKNILCGKYAFGHFANDKSILGNSAGENIYIMDSAYTDVESFKAAMAGVILYYELAEPIVTELDAEDQNFRDYYQVADFGTEMSQSNVPSAPFSADIIYQFNAVDMIRENYNEIQKLKANGGNSYDDTEIKNQIASKVDANYVNSAINSAITNTLNTEV